MPLLLLLRCPLYHVAHARPAVYPDAVGGAATTAEEKAFTCKYRVTMVVAHQGWVDLIWDVPPSCLGSGQLQKRPTSQGTPEI